MRRFKLIDWFNILAPVPIGLIMGFMVSVWWLLIIVAGILYGSYMWRMLWVMEELGQIREGLTDAATGNTKPLSEIRMRLKDEVK